MRRRHLWVPPTRARTRGERGSRLRCSNTVQQKTNDETLLSMLSRRAHALHLKTDLQLCWHLHLLKKGIREALTTVSRDPPSKPSKKLSHSTRSPGGPERKPLTRSENGSGESSEGKSQPLCSSNANTATLISQPGSLLSSHHAILFQFTSCYFYFPIIETHCCGPTRVSERPVRALLLHPRWCVSTNNFNLVQPGGSKMQ